LDPVAAEKAVRSVTIVHPHGFLGSLQFQNYTNDGFGTYDADLPAISSLIRTYSEENANSEKLSHIEELCDNPKNLVFLGFSYHPKNLEILFPRSMKPNGEVYGTAYQLFPRRIREAGKFYSPNIAIITTQNAYCRILVLS
jgi:hypothetical protein